MAQLLRTRPSLDLDEHAKREYDDRRRLYDQWYLDDWAKNHGKATYNKITTGNIPYTTVLKDPDNQDGLNISSFLEQVSVCTMWSKRV